MQNAIDTKVALYTLKRTFGKRAIVSWPNSKIVDRTIGTVSSTDNNITVQRLIVLPLRYNWSVLATGENKGVGEHLVGDREFVVDKSDVAIWTTEHVIRVLSPSGTLGQSYRTVSYDEYDGLFHVIGRKI
jgi:hypothetical protein